MSRDLLIYFDDDFDETIVHRLAQDVERLRRSRRWTLGPPEFVDETDDTGRTLPEDEPVRTVGLVLGVSDPGEIPDTPREEVAFFVDEAARFSESFEVDMVLLLGDLYVGEIRRGVPNKSVREGLIETW